MGRIKKAAGPKHEATVVSLASFSLVNIMGETFLTRFSP